MYSMPSHFCISSFRSQRIVFAVLTTLFFSFVPSLTFAEQVSATLSASSGAALINGQESELDAIMGDGDVLEIPAGANATVKLSDGSRLELGEHARLELTTLELSSTGARNSFLTLSQGRVRAKLSQEHQATGSSFEIETPNALIGVTFSQPDVEVNYDPATEETIALARTVALSAKNLLTDEEKTIPVGSAVIISLLGMKVASGAAATELMTSAIAKSAKSSAAAAATGTGAAETTTATTVGVAETTTAGGLGTGTMVAIGAGAAAAVGGIAVLAAGGSDNDDDNDGSSSNNDSSASVETYSTNDLEDNWTFTISDTENREGEMTLDSQGNLINYSGPGHLISYSGGLNTSDTSTVEGTITHQAGYHPEQECYGHVNTVTFVLLGSFVSKNQIAGTFTETGTTTCEFDSLPDRAGTFSMTR